MNKIYEEIAKEWDLYENNPLTYADDLCKSVINEYDNDTKDDIAMELEKNKNLAGIFSFYASLSVKKLEPDTKIVLPREEDILVGMRIGENDKVTAFNLSIGGYLWCTTTLHPGKPTLIMKDAYVIPILAIAFSNVTIEFTQEVPNNLECIYASAGGGINGNCNISRRRDIQTKSHLFSLSSTTNALIKNGIAYFPSLYNTIPNLACEVPDINKLILKLKNKNT